MKHQSLTLANTSLRELSTPPAAVQATSTPSILRLKDVQRLTGYSRASIYAMLNPRSRQYRPDFPQKFRLSGEKSSRGAVGWLASDIYAWIHRVATQPSTQGVSK